MLITTQEKQKNQEAEREWKLLQMLLLQFGSKLTLGWTLSFDSNNPISWVNNYKIITPVQHHLGSIQ